MLQHNKKNEKTPNTFVDGVAVKISEQYKPPRKITLPFSCQNCSPSESLYSEYDFRLENNVMTKLMEWKKMRQEEVEKQKGRKDIKEVCQDLEHFHNLTLGDVEDERVEQSRQICNPKLGDSILTPVCAKVNSPSNKPASSLFNLSDFESDNSSPFDNMELKTINDMEVLASILTTDNMKQSFNNNYNIIDKELNKKGLPLNRYVDWGQTSVNGCDSYPPSGHNGVINTTDINCFGALNSISENYQFYNYELNNFSNQCGPGASSCPASTLKSQEWQTSENRLENRGFRVDLTSQGTDSKSVPDIVNELQKELEENRERDVVAERRIGTPTPETGGQKMSKSSKSGKKSSRKLSDPTEYLNPEMLKLAHHISEMGFPLPRVSRACKFFEGDDKKVVEFLLQVQNLEEESNYPGDLVERALHVNNFKTNETVNYLNAMMVLLDLGFDEAKVEDALKKTNSDRDKALDMLIS